MCGFEPPGYISLQFCVIPQVRELVMPKNEILVLRSPHLALKVPQEERQAPRFSWPPCKQQWLRPSKMLGVSSKPRLGRFDSEAAI